MMTLTPRVKKIAASLGAAAVTLAVALPMALGGGQQYPLIVSPKTGQPFPQLTVATGATCPAAQQCNATGTTSAPVTIHLPTAPADGATLAVVDADGNAAVHTLTVAGAGGKKIDGASSTPITLSGGGLVAEYSSAAGEWVTVLFQRKIDGSLSFLNVDTRAQSVVGSVTLAGDVTGPSSANTAAKINGTTVPAGGGLSTGAVLRATGAAAASWGAVDLANASAVTGQLPVAQGGTGATSFFPLPTPSTAGNVATSDGAGHWTSAAPSGGGGGWQTALDVSFAGVTDPGLSANGTYTLATTPPISVKRENAAQDLVPMTITASGIVISPGVSSYAPDGNVRTAPLLWIQLAPFATIDWTSGLRLSLRIASSSQSGFDNGHGTFVAVDSDSTALASYCRQGTNGGNLRQFTAGVAVNATGARANQNAGGGMSTGVVVFTCEIPSIVQAQQWTTTLWRDSVAAWPDLSTLNPVVAQGSALSPFNAINASNVAASSLLGIVIAASSPNSVNDAYVVTISNLRVDTRL